MKLSADRIIFFDKYVGKLIVEKYGLADKEAIRLFISSETYQMLLDTGKWKSYWRTKKLTIYKRWITLSKESDFFVYLLEHYANYKNTTAEKILKILDEKELTDYVYDMYEIYHSESLDNAFNDIDSLIEKGKTAW